MLCQVTAGDHGVKISILSTSAEVVSFYHLLLFRKHSSLWDHSVSREYTRFLAELVILILRRVWKFIIIMALPLSTFTSVNVRVLISERNRFFIKMQSICLRCIPAGLCHVHFLDGFWLPSVCKVWEFEPSVICLQTDVVSRYFYFIFCSLKWCKIHINFTLVLVFMLPEETACFSTFLKNST